MLLVGPPGTGKTLLARAVAGEAKVPFFSLSGSEFVEMFVGVGAARVRDLFAQAEAKAPCIIFIDELDALGKVRIQTPMGSHEEREQTLNQLLAEMDGFDARKGVIIMAATNRPEVLDPALLRPGRFDRQVLVDKPDVRGREEILRIHVKNVKVAENVDLKVIAARTAGFAGADLANLVNEAALLAARRDKTAVDMKDFDEAIDRVIAGLEKKRVMSDKERRIVAYHESGHAIVASVLPGLDPVHKISIIGRGFGALGYTMQLPLEDRYLMTRQDLQSQLAVLLGGRSAEEIAFGEISTGAQNDLQRATDIARAMVTEFGMSDALGAVNYNGHKRSAFLDTPFMQERGNYAEETAQKIDAEVKRILTEAHDEARRILRERRHVLDELSERLLVKEVIESEELRELMGPLPPKDPDAVPAEIPPPAPQQLALATRLRAILRPSRVKLAPFCGRCSSHFSSRCSRRRRATPCHSATAPRRRQCLGVRARLLGGNGHAHPGRARRPRPFFDAFDATNLRMPVESRQIRCVHGRSRTVPDHFGRPRCLLRRGHAEQLRRTLSGGGLQRGSRQRSRQADHDRGRRCSARCRHRAASVPGNRRPRPGRSRRAAVAHAGVRGAPHARQRRAPCACRRCPC